MNRITPHLWFDRKASEAARQYTSIFKNSGVTGQTTLRDTPSGDTEVVSFQLAGQPFQAISAGPEFKFNPSISFHVRCQGVEEADTIWGGLSEGGNVLMEYGQYPWSERYGWLQDRYGLSWQVVFAREAEVVQVITPVLMFVGAVCGRAEEALCFYTSVFAARGGGSEVGPLQRYGGGEEPNAEGTLRYGSFTLKGQEFGAMDSALDHDFAFNEAISFLVPCEEQEEVDYFWEALSADPEAEQCGWLKDRYGVSWQIVPTALEAMMARADKRTLARVTEAFLNMKKLDIAELEAAYRGG